jgi:phenylpropionate dioxygenase-like ring-hydroxylating dioxygenase large terminal subunit
MSEHDPKAIPYPPSLMIEKPPYRPGIKRVAVDRYFKPEYHDREVERIWKKSWQWACREEHIPNVGDYIVYEVANLSFIVIRTAEDEFKAYWNSCLHRGRKLCTFDGKRASELRCMFHGWAWHIDGRMKDMTSGYDFPGLGDDEVSRLPEAKVGTWGGFVFINPDSDCEPLADFLGELPDHFEGAGHDLRDRWVQAHVQADLPANWKVAQEAFLEAWHSGTTHPQITRPPGDRTVAGNRWDDFGNWMRSAPALPTDQYKSPPGWSYPADHDQRTLDQHYDRHLNEEPKLIAEEGVSAREVLGKRVRAFFTDLLGEEAERMHDVHLMGGEMISVWPNFHPWGGYSRLLYRFRPNKDNPDRSIMDVMLMAPVPKGIERPPPAPVHVLGPDDPISSATQLGYLARIFEQDMGNMPYVQEGLKTSRLGYVILSSHNDAPVRKFHDMYDEWMGFENGDFLASEYAE